MTMQHGISAPMIPLSEVVDRYLLAKRISKRKYYAAYLQDAMLLWKDLFRDVLKITYSSWQQVYSDNPYPYIYLPKCTERVFSFSVLDNCNNIVPLSYNSEKNIEPLPKKKKLNCGCGDCHNSICEAVDSMVMTTKVVFTINGVDYKEKKWTKFCDDGCVVEYTETPVKRYNDGTGNAGDFNEDFNDDYYKGGELLGNYDIIYEKSQRKICELEKKECGCPADTENNKKIISDSLFQYVHPCCKNTCLPNGYVESKSGYGSIKISSCGTKAYFIADWRNVKTPEFINVSGQFNGDNPNGEIMIPDYAINCMFYGLDYYSKRFNISINMYHRDESRRLFEAEQMELIRFLNPIRLSFLKEIQSEEIKW